MLFDHSLNDKRFRIDIRVENGYEEGCKRGVMPFYLYVLINSVGNTYIGQTADIERRLAQHNDPKCRLTLYTKRFPGPWKLIHCEELPTRSAAILRERQLKTGKGRDWIRRTLLHGC